MLNTHLAVETFAPCQDVDIISGGVESLAIAALLSARGRSVGFAREGFSMPEQLVIRGESTNYRAGRLQTGKQDAADPLYSRRPDIMVLTARAVDYPQALDMVAERLAPGQTVFITDAPMGTAFELSTKLFKLRKRMAVNIVEMGPLFDECYFEGRSLEIIGLKEQVSICGRSVNETRTCMPFGRQLFSGLVPASNVLERGLNDTASLLKTALRMFLIHRSPAAKQVTPITELNKAEDEILSALESEIQTLAKIFNVTVPERTELSFAFSDSLERERQSMAAGVCENFVMLAELAAKAYHPVPTIDSIIDEASKAAARDLRSEGRKLSDLGLSGMDIREIIEFINS
ncbi:MAG: hypothetical protein K2X77_29985 [Candidatus Obscuribacterales bacterium]|jgi:hypothetical protein|nr:hypothetical protein [Candidatus Obscuribacterales bacterium]